LSLMAEAHEREKMAPTRLLREDRRRVTG
jgi:hypothetical protein